MPILRAGRTIVNSNQISPGIIVNSDINASAAIEASKIQELSLGVNAGVIPTTGIANAHIAAAAAIAFSKLAAGTQGGVLIMGASGVPQDLGAGTLGQVLASQGAGANPQWSSAGLSVATASDTLQASADTETSGVQTSYVKEKEIQILLPGKIRVKYSTKNTGAGDCLSNLYINGVAVGTERTNSTTSYVEYSEDIFISAGDLIQLYAYKVGSTSIQCDNFRIYYTKGTAANDYVVNLDA